MVFTWETWQRRAGFLVHLGQLCFGLFDIGLQHKKHGQGFFHQRKFKHIKRSAQPRQQVLLSQNLPTGMLAVFGEGERGHMRVVAVSRGQKEA